MFTDFFFNDSDARGVTLERCNTYRPWLAPQSLKEDGENISGLGLSGVIIGFNSSEQAYGSIYII